VFDPTCGGGRIPRAAAAAGYTPIASDIVNRLNWRGLEYPFTICDFLKDSLVRSAWSVVCNPPFNHVQEFCERPLEIAIYKAAILVPLRRLPAVRWLQRLPLETVWLLTPRSSMPPGSRIKAGNNPGGGAWLVFNTRLMAGSTPLLRWLHRDPVHRPAKHFADARRDT